VLLSLDPLGDIPDRITKNGGGMWRQCGAAMAQVPVNPSWNSESRKSLRRLRAKRQKLPFCHDPQGFFECQKVDNSGGRSLYTSSWARRRWARCRVCEAPHCSHGDRAIRHLGMAMFASPRRMRGVSSCLKSESEERETWTAESLRAAFANGEGLPSSRDDCGHGRDFGGRRFRSTLWPLSASNRFEWSKWDLVKTCDQPRSDLSNLRV
jgi:hypothetical protein